MYKLIVCIFLISCCSTKSLISQDKTILVYSQNSDILLPMIENQLSKLLFYGSKNGFNYSTAYFRDVRNLNEQISNFDFQDSFSKFFNTIKTGDIESSFNYTESDILSLKKMKSEISKNDYFLFVRSNVIGSNIEFQFYLIKPKALTSKVPLSFIEDRIAVTNFIISVDKEDEEVVIRNNLEKLLDNSNTVPIAKLFIEGKEVKNGERIEIPEGTTITLDGKFSTDADEDEIIYQWRNLKSVIGDKTIKRFDFIENSSTQKITVPGFGYYSIEFNVYDQVQKSKSIKFTIFSGSNPTFGSKYIDTIVNHVAYLGASDLGKYSTIISLDVHDIRKIFKVSSILTSKPIGAKRVEQIKDSIYHEFVANEHGFPKLRFEDFDYILGKDHSYYLYSHNAETGYIGDATPYHVKKLLRSPVNLSIGYDFMGHSSNGDSIATISYSTFEIGLFFNKRFEANLKVPLRTKSITISDTTETLTFSSLGLRFYSEIISENLPETNYTFVQLNLGYKKKDDYLEGSAAIGIEAGWGLRLFKKRNLPISLNLHIGFMKVLKFTYLTPLTGGVTLRYNLAGS